MDFNDKLKKAMSVIKEFKLPQGFSPEKFLYKLYRDKIGDTTDEILVEMDRIKCGKDPHSLLYDVADRLNISVQELVLELLEKVDETDSWKDYISPIRQWLESKKDL